MIVSVSWYSSSLTSVFHDAGNRYLSAVGPLLGANNVKHRVFCTSNIGAAAPGGNRVHVTWSCSLVALRHR